MKGFIGAVPYYAGISHNASVAPMAPEAVWSRTFPSNCKAVEPPRAPGPQTLLRPSTHGGYAPQVVASGRARIKGNGVNKALDIALMVDRGQEYASSTSICLGSL